MLDLYGSALVRERLRLDDGSDVGRYLKWEYGKGTGRAVLAVRAPARGKPRPGRRPALVGLMATFVDAIRGRPGTARYAGMEREMTLVAQWKVGRIRTIELVGLLEDLRRREVVEVTRRTP